LFRQRIREQRIRDCHGDLHLEHIHITPRTLCIYDCIEFNDRLRYVDIANDAAFLAMDLDHNGRPDLSRHFAQAMAEALEDPGLLELMDFYKCYRACVRGKVESFRFGAQETAEIERRRAREAAQAYFRLALQYAVAGSQPLVLMVMGRVASGKSFLAGALAHELGWELLSSDRMRKELFNVPINDRGDAGALAQLYSRSATNRTYKALFERAAAHLRKGRGVVVDATFSRRDQRRFFREKLDSIGAAYCFVEVCAGEATRRKRLRQRDGRAGEISDARIEDVDAIDGIYEEPAEFLGKKLVRVRSTGRPVHTLTQTVLLRVASSC
jgi:uncharacterized protein